MNKRRIALVFEGLQEVHLHKDVGMIPYVLARDFQYESEILFLKDKNNSGLEGLSSIVKNVPFAKRFCFLPDKFGFQIFKKIGLLYYLAVHARKIDVLMLFHPSYDRYFFTRLYKLLNPKGLVYLKLDMGHRTLSYLEKLIAENKMRFSYFFRRNIELTDIISIETYDKYKILSAGFVGIDISTKLIHIPNGFDESNKMDFDFEDKGNIIITVGRIGTYEKNTEMFLSIVEKLNLRDWKIFLIGPIEPSFEITLCEFYNRNSELKDKVFVVGNISDKETLYEWYRKSKVFCLTSRYEAFPLVFPEALYFGNYIVTTDVGAANDITKDQALGKICGIDDVAGMVSILQSIIDEDIDLKSYYAKITHHAKDQFIWNKIVNQLHGRLEQLYEN